MSSNESASVSTTAHSVFTPRDIAGVAPLLMCSVIQSAPTRTSDDLVMAIFEIELWGVTRRYKVRNVDPKYKGFLGSPRPFPVKLEHTPDGILVVKVRLAEIVPKDADPQGWVRCEAIRHS